MRKKYYINFLCLLIILTSCKSEYKKKDFSASYEVNFSGSNENEDIKYTIDSEVGVELAFFGEYYYEYQKKGTLSILNDYSTSTNYAKVEMSEYNVDIFDFNTNKRIKEINIIEKSEEYVDMSMYQFTKNMIYGIVKKEENYYLVITMEKIPSNEEMKEKESKDKYNFYVGINDDICYFDEMSYQKQDKIIVYESNLEPLGNWEFTTTNAPVDDDQGFGLSIGYNPYWYDTEEKDVSILKINISRLNHLLENDILLYEEFPEIKEYVENYSESDSKYLTLYMKNKDWKEVMSLFMPKGKEITFEGVKLYSDETKDGEEHVINSYDEYKEYVK